MTPQQAALLAAELTEQLAELHARGAAHDPVDGRMRVESVAGRLRPVINESGPALGHDCEADDVRAVGVLLAELLGAPTGPGQDPPRRPDGIPEALWLLVGAALASDPTARPTIALLNRQLRDAARDLLLGVAPWPVVTGAHDGPATGSPEPTEIEVPVPGYVPGPDDATRPAAPARSRRGARWAIVAAASATAVLLAAVGIVGSRMGSADRTAETGKTTDAPPSATAPDVPTTGPATAPVDPAPPAPATNAPAPPAGGAPAPPQQAGGQPPKPKPPAPPSGGSTLNISTNYGRATGSVSWNGTTAKASGTIFDTAQNDSQSWLRIAYRLNEGGTWKVHYASPDPYVTVANGTSKSFSWSMGGAIKDVQWDLCSKRSGKSYCTGWK